MPLRSAFDQLLVVIGVILIVVPTALVTESWTPLVVVFVGIAMIGMGVYSLGSRLMSDRRVYVGLRSEVEGFLKLVRRLNAHALASETEAVEEISEEMKGSVERMVYLAGQPESKP